MWDEVCAPPGAQHSASLRAITGRQLQALVRRLPQSDHELPAEDDEDPRDDRKDGLYGPESSEAEPHQRFKTLYQEPDAQKEHAKILRESHGCAPCLRVEDGRYCKVQGWQPPNGPRLSCGRLARRRKVAGR